MHDPFATKTSTSPFETYRQARLEAPVQWSPTLRAWVLTRMDHVKAVLDDDEGYEAVEAAQPVRELARRSGRSYEHIARLLDATLFFKNGSAHLRDRRTLARVANRIPLSKLRPIVVQFANELAEAMMRQDHPDLIADFAAPLPQMVMAVILGLPLSDVPRLETLLAEATLIFDPVSLERCDRIEADLRAALQLLGERIRTAKDAADDSGLRMIYEATQGNEDERLDLAAATTLFLFRVGAETTTGLIGLIAKALLDDAGLRRRLREDPGLIEAFTCEVLRLESPVQRSTRVARTAQRLGDQPIQVGERVILLLGAANRDPEASPNADAANLDSPSRDDVAFGLGAHYCLGASLAKTEAAIAVATLLRLEALEQDGPESWYVGATIRRLTHLPARLARRRTEAARS